MYFDILVSIVAVFSISYYFITVLQWYSYKISRVLFHFNNPFWHILYFIIPILTYFVAEKWFWIYLFFGLLPALFMWQKKVKNALKFTDRVKRFFIILTLFEVINLLLFLKINQGIMSFIVIILAVISSEIVEKVIFEIFRKRAIEKLKKLNPKIVAITASYGKTSIKNFLYQILEKRYSVYKTPRSVNTLKGLVLDVNRDLPIDVEIYIAEAGAREKGDILEISEFLNHQYAVIGKIGPQHIEYFKTMENIIETKKEILKSNSLKRIISYEDIENSINIKDKISNIKSNLDGIEFDLEYHSQNFHFNAPILGDFNAINIGLAIYMAKEFGMEMSEIIKRVANIESVPHRLQKIEVGGKIIIDDGFNSNIDGVLSSIDLVSEYNGRKVIITPGIIEGNKELNKEIAKKIDEVFDLVIITGKENRKVLCENINRPPKIYLGDKRNLENILAQNTKIGDLILFSNDAPEYL